GRHRAITERLQQLGGDGRQRGRLGSWFAWHRHSLASCYAPNTKLMTGPDGCMIPDKGVLHWVCFAKYAAAFFKMSRSSVTRRSSAFRRRTSWDCSFTSRRAPSSPAYCLRHWYKLQVLTPRRAATSATLWPRSVVWRTASILNSSENRFCMAFVLMTTPQRLIMRHV